MKFLQWTILLSGLLLDVHISAEGVFLPKDCWGKSEPCAVENDSAGRLSLKTADSGFNLGKGAVVQTIDANSASLAIGTMLAHHEKDFRWHTPFGDVLCHHCEVLLTRGENSVEIHALKGRVQIVRKGDDEKYELPAGYMVLMSTVESDGRANLDFPKSSPLRPLLKTWAKVYPGSESDFKKELEDYVGVWKDAVENSSQMQQSAADREIASYQSEQDKLKRARQARQAEEERLRKLFREKALQ